MAVKKDKAVMGPKAPRFRNLSERRGTEIITPKNNNKRIEEIDEILNRVVRANCCLVNKSPEKFETLV